MFVCVNACASVKLSADLPIMPLTVPKSTEPWVGVELSPRFCSTSEPWQKTLTNSPRWKTPTSCRCCRSSSVVAALTAGRTAGERGGITNIVGWSMCDVRGSRQEQTERVEIKSKSTNIEKKKKKDVKGKVGNVCGHKRSIKQKKNKQGRDMRSIGKGQRVIEK